MAHRPSCRSCRHCAAPSGAQVGCEGRPGWCHMRQLTIPSELSGELWCPHWTARPPRLPLNSQTKTPAGAGGPIDQQLSLTGIFEGMGLELLAGLPLAE
jgi:hypothetical protein